MKKTKITIQKTLSFLLAAVLLLSCFPLASAEDSTKQHEIVKLDGKKILVIGNSMLYYGNCVNMGNQGNNDSGYLYRLIRSNGERATVIDHTYSGKNINYIYENYLVNLPAEELASFDYVVMSEAAQENDNFLEDCHSLMALFPQNPEFYFMCHPMLYEYELTCITDHLGTLMAEGVNIVDWGQMVYSIYSGSETVEGVTLEYNRETFIKDNVGFTNGDFFIGSEKEGDDKHPNPLSGYIAAQALYTAITNRAAQYSDYSFCGDADTHKYFNFDAFIAAHYNGEKTTNFDKVFASPEDMLALQKMIDRYNELEGRHSFAELLGIDPTCESSGLSHGLYCTVCLESIVPQEIIPSLGGHEAELLPYVEPTCTTAGKTAGLECKVCDKKLLKQNKIPALGHDEKTKVTPSTLAKAGKRVTSCQTCGEELKNQKIYRIRTPKLSTTTYTYNGKTRKPSVTVTDWQGIPLEENTDYSLSYSSGRKKAGTYTVTVKFMGDYSGESVLSFKIIPKSTEITSVTPKSRALKLRWKEANSSALSYEIQYSTSKSFSSKQSLTVKSADTLTKTVKSLKAKKTYYLRIRTFRTIKGSNYYSNWSSTVSAKTKK